MMQGLDVTRIVTYLIFLMYLSLTHYKHFFMMKCRVRGTQWTITMSPAKLVSGVSQ